MGFLTSPGRAGLDREFAVIAGFQVRLVLLASDCILRNMVLILKRE
jgi:hypothetical protein